MDPGAPAAGRALLDDPAFRGVLSEMQALGLHVDTAPVPDSVPCVVLNPRRADLRRWLVPLRPASVRVSALAIIQPVRLRARALKRIVIWMRGFGLQALGSSARVYVSGMPRVAAAVGVRATHGAVFTGTPGPHRKTVVQLMDARGAILGYVKAARSAAASALLRHEAFIIRQLQTLGIESAWIPGVLFHGTVRGATVLVTSTLKTPGSACPTRLRRMHIAFLRELTARTASAWAVPWATLLAEWNDQVRQLGDALAPAWHARFAASFALLAQAPALVESRGLAHGDFTPTNTFQEHGRLCVFDWEYAGGNYPADFDLVCFLGRVPRIRKLRPVQRGPAIARILTRRYGRTPMEAHRRVTAFVCAYALRGAIRQPRVHGTQLQWEGHAGQAQMLDALLADAPGA